MERAGRPEMIREWFESEGVEIVLFDMDETLVDTREHYRERMRAYCVYLAKESGKPEDELFDLFMEGVMALRDEFQVRSAVLDVPARVLAKMCGVEGLELESQIDELMKIYELPPKVLPGAVEQVRMMRDAGLKMVLVTHADEEWTQRKLSQGFLDLFDEVICTPVHLPKDIKAWEKALRKLGVDLSQVMVVGDSWVSDVKPALELGVNKVVWVGGDGKGEEIGGVIKVDKIADLVERLLVR